MNTKIEISIRRAVRRAIDGFQITSGEDSGAHT
jgi:hypothetical protein